MNTRRSIKLVTFDAPFQLQAMEEMRPAGDYEVTIEEEQIGEFMYEAFRRTATTIYLPPRGGDFGMGQVIPVEPGEFAKLMKLTGHSPERS
jgi:hypothetical protein